MCRFLLVKSIKPINPFKLLQSFSSMAKKSKAYDGDWQGDGWGIAWITKNSWYSYKSLSPIWDEPRKFQDFPETSIFAVHARSASFPRHKNNLFYNQPFINPPWIFVFNGLLKGVSLPSLIPGEIGAQKIWYLLQKQLAKNQPGAALEKIKKLLVENTKELQALNIGLADKNNLYALCFYNRFPSYYQLHYLINKDITAICSEVLPFSFWKEMKSSQTLKL